MVFVKRIFHLSAVALLRNSLVLLPTTSGVQIIPNLVKNVRLKFFRNLSCVTNSCTRIRMSDQGEDKAAPDTAQDPSTDKSEKDSTEISCEITEKDSGANADASFDCEKEKDTVCGYRKKTRKRKRKDPNLHVTFKRPRLTDNDSMTKTNYYFENGLRKVIPYDHKYNTFCKGRWVGKTLAEVYSNEFRLYPIEFYDKAIREGRLLVNLKRPESLGQILKDNDLLTSTVHRHECPVSDAAIEVIADNNEYFVINKPCSIPLHPAGRFRYNSLVSILAKEFNKKEIHSVHRLDRMTSGVCMFAKSKKLANKMHSQIKNRQVVKEYVCRVVGDFTKFSLPSNCGHNITVGGDEITVNEPIKVYDVKIGTSVVSRDEEAKECLTVFKCLSTDGNTSIVSCKPKTGRTHQIRVHLQYLGFPITNDTLYNNSAWGEERFKLGPITKPMDQIVHQLADMKKWLAMLDDMKLLNKEEDGNTDDNSEKTTFDPPIQSEALKEAIASMGHIVPYRPNCAECRTPLSDPKPDELVMYLHALRYKGLDWEFETPVPKWASPGWTE